MKQKKPIIGALFLLAFGLTALQAQQTVPTAGGNASGSGGSASYSVGQVAYTTLSGSDGTITQGVQQPYEIQALGGIAEAAGITLECAVYPNPVTDFVKLKIDASAMLSIRSLSYQLYDLSGKLLESRKIEGSETTISMGNLVTASYFLKITGNNKEIKTFKIIKNY